MSNLLSVVKDAIDSGVENRKIDLKRQLDLRTRPGQAKIAKLISALANTPGGASYVVIGVKDLKDRETTTRNPIDYVTGFDRASSDESQRIIQAALAHYVVPIPDVELHVVEYPGINQCVGVLKIERSFKRPHRIVQASEGVQPGVYIKRGAETYPATEDEQREMQLASEGRRLIINFHRQIEMEQAAGIIAKFGYMPEIIGPPRAVDFKHDQSFADQAKQLVDEVGLTTQEWATLHLVVNLPGLATAAATILAEIHGRAGRFPDLLRLRPTAHQANQYQFAEVVPLQNVRDAARESAAAKS